MNKTLFSGFEFGHISAFGDRKGLVDQVLTWIDLRAHGSISYTGALKEGENLSFTGKVLDPRATESYVLEWDFDYVGSSFTKDDSNSTVTHTYDDDGNFTVAMRIHEQRTNTYSPLVTIPLDIVNQAPEANISSASPGEEAQPIRFWGNGTDPGFNDTVFTYEWDFDYDGSNFTVDNVEKDPMHTYQENGTFTVALRVTDDEGSTSAINTTIVIIRNLPPSGIVYTAGTSDEGELVPFSAVVEDPSPFDTVSTAWDFEYDGQRFTEMANGTSVSHVYRDDGIYTVVLRLWDEDGGVANITVQVDVRNLLPSANFTSTAPVEEGGVVDFSGNVTDPGELDVHTFEW
ncbi:MAG: PKD domain-containing protein, partial [Thermoplasmata archaeon]|nr:PKD domain-containing protein [Thermoplasmata archaeon]